VQIMTDEAQVMNNGSLRRLMGNQHQLIVLGNGFDLECGLRSKYTDFRDLRKWTMRPSGGTEDLFDIANDLAGERDELKGLLSRISDLLKRREEVRLEYLDFMDSGSCSSVVDWGKRKLEISEEIKQLKKTVTKKCKNILGKKGEDSQFNLKLKAVCDIFLFFNRRDVHTKLVMKKSDIVKKDYCKGAYEAGLTVWDILLCDKNLFDWFNVESAIQQQMTSIDKSKSYRQIASVISRILNNQFFSPSSFTEKNGAIDVEDIAAWFLYHNYENYFSSEKVLSNDELNQFVARVMLTELIRFEDAFGKYLQSAIENAGPYYYEHAGELLRIIANADMDNTGNIMNISILSFNYTNPLGESLEINGTPTTLVNVHGSYTQHCIFGIDGKDYMLDNDIRPFTKTYRLMSLNNPNIGQLVHTYHAGMQDNSTNMIKFYGHSLGEADYSYFQSIFDGVNLYESHTRLMFFYRPKRNEDGSRGNADGAEEDMKDKVSKLLTEYGKTMENKDHGRNLIHKLLLEGRLEVRAIPQNN